jgi:hypothetical protein
MSNYGKDEIERLKEMYNEMESIEAKELNPVQMMEESLYSFLEYRLKKLRESIDFQDIIKKYIEARISEADFNDLRILLNQEQQNLNNSSMNILAPLLNQQTSETSPKNKNKAIDEKLFAESSKENLQSFNELFQFMNEMKALVETKTKNTKLKDALEQSIEEAR